MDKVIFHIRFSRRNNVQVLEILEMMKIRLIFA